MKESSKDALYGAAIGAALPASIFVPAFLYTAAQGDLQFIKGIAPFCAVIAGMWAMKGANEFRGMRSVRQERKGVRVSSRMTLGERFRDEPKAPSEVAQYIQGLYENWELTALHEHTIATQDLPSRDSEPFAKAFDPAIVNAEIALIIAEKFSDYVKNDYKSRRTTEEIETRTQDARMFIELLKFGWKSLRWREKGGKIHLDENKLYHEAVVAGAFTEWVKGHTGIQDKKGMGTFLQMLNHYRQ